MSGSPITRAAALTIAPAGGFAEPELQAILHDNAAGLLGQR